LNNPIPFQQTMAGNTWRLALRERVLPRSPFATRALP
jgi:hypothetical protein